MFVALPRGWEPPRVRRSPLPPPAEEPSVETLTDRQFCSFYALLVRSRLTLRELPANARPQREPNRPLGQYLERLYVGSGAPRECCLASLVLMWRFDARCSSLGIAPYNVYRLALVSLIVACKMDADIERSMAFWNQLSDSFYGERTICLLEKQFLEVLDYDVLLRAGELRSFLCRPEVRRALQLEDWAPGRARGPREPDDPGGGERAELGDSPRAARPSRAPRSPAPARA